jgi:hypothetical protein
MMTTCKHCGGAHPVWECKRPVTKSTAARKDVLRQVDRLPHKAAIGEFGHRPPQEREAGTQALPVDTNLGVGSEGFLPFTSKPASCTAPDRRARDKDDQPIPKRKVGRPKFITDLKAYKAMKQKEYRKKWKERGNDVV